MHKVINILTKNLRNAVMVYLLNIIHLIQKERERE